jgi:hypothetical protein
MKPKRPSPAMIVALLALVMSTTGGAIAAVNYARNSAAVDGYSAVSARSSNDKAAGRLVATHPAGDLKGKLPFRFLSGAASANELSALAGSAARGRNGAYLVPVADNAATQEQNVIDLGVGNLQLTCVDTDPTAGVEDAAIRVGVTNYSSGSINVSRRLGTGRQFIRTLSPGTVEAFDVSAENTFSAQVQAPPSKTVLIEGTAFQQAPGTADSSCAGWATAIFVG